MIVFRVEQYLMLEQSRHVQVNHVAYTKQAKKLKQIVLEQRELFPARILWHIQAVGLAANVKLKHFRLARHRYLVKQVVQMRLEANAEQIRLLDHVEQSVEYFGEGFIKRILRQQAQALGCVKSVFERVIVAHLRWRVVGRRALVVCVVCQGFCVREA